MRWQAGRSSGSSCSVWSTVLLRRVRASSRAGGLGARTGRPKMRADWLRRHGSARANPLRATGVVGYRLTEGDIYLRLTLRRKVSGRRAGLDIISPIGPKARHDDMPARTKAASHRGHSHVAERQLPTACLLLHLAYSHANRAKDGHDGVISLLLLEVPSRGILETPIARLPASRAGIDELKHRTYPMDCLAR